MPRTFRMRGWPFALLAVLALAGGLFCLAGYIMAADFTVADSANLAHWQQVAKVYLGLTCLAVVLLGAALVGWRRARRLRGEIISPAI